MIDKSFSQYKQDLNVLDFYCGMRRGYFLDVGAFDGITISNTYKLENEFEWNGVCIEPTTEIFEKLQSNRSASCVNSAVFSESGKKLKFSRSANDVLSGLSDFLDGWGRDIALKGSTSTVTTTTLTEVLDKNNSPAFIHFLSLDTEGSELEILMGLDLDQYIFGYVCVEHNHINTKRIKIRMLLEKHNYIFIGENNCDDNYCHRSLIGGIYFFRQNFSKPIEVTVSSDNRVVAASGYWTDQEGTFIPEKMQILFDNLGTMRINALRIEKNPENRWEKLPFSIGV